MYNGYLFCSSKLHLAKILINNISTAKSFHISTLKSYFFFSSSQNFISKVSQDSPGLSDLHLVLDDGVVHTQKLLIVHSLPILGKLIKTTSIPDNDPVTVYLPGISRWVKVFTDAFPTTVPLVEETFFQTLKTFFDQKSQLSTFSHTFWKFSLMPRCEDAVRAISNKLKCWEKPLKPSQI